MHHSKINDAEIKGSPCGSPGLSKVPSFEASSRLEYIAWHTVPAYRTSAYLVYAFPAHSTSFSTSAVECVITFVNHNLYLW